MMSTRLRFALTIDFLCICALIFPIIVIAEYINNGTLTDLIMIFIAFPVIYCAYIFSPLIFRNASIGMKLLGFRIVDEDFGIPSVKLILKRGVWAPRLSLEWAKSIFTGNDTSAWELKHLGTQIVYVRSTD